MSERPQMTPALGLVRDRLAGPPPRRSAEVAPTLTPGPADTAPGEADHDSDQAQAGATNTSEERRPRKPSRAKASDAATGGLKRTTVSIPQQLAEALRKKLSTDRTVSQSQFILNAIEANAADLPDLLDAERPSSPAGGSLFPDRRPTRANAEARTTINFDTTERNLRVVDSLVEQHGADSRSQLVRATLRAALT